MYEKQTIQCFVKVCGAVSGENMNSLSVPRLLRVASTQWKFLIRSSTNSGAQTPETKACGKLNDKEPYWRKSNPNLTVKGFDAVPGPKFLPIIGHEWRYKPFIGQYDRDRIHHTFKKLLDQYGYVVREHIGRKRVIVHLFHDEDISKVYKNEGQYPSRMSNRIMERYRRERPHHYLSAGLGPSNGEEWYTFRTQFNKAHGAFLKDCHEDNLEKLSNDLVTKITNRLNKDGEVDIMPDFYRWTLEGVGIVTLSRRLGCLDAVPNMEADKLIEAAHTTNDVIFRTEMSARGWEKQYKRLVPAQDYFSKVVRQYIDEALINGNNLLDSICTPGIDTRDLYTFVLDLFQAGIHTTAVSAAFILYHLARNPAVQQELRDQLYIELPTKDARYEDTDLRSLPLLRNILKESLRMNPPTIGNGRLLPAQLVLGGYRIPAGTMVLLHHMVASRLEENFPSPHLFKPERFAAGKHDYSPEFHDTTQAAFMPFGFGNRACIGKHLAIAQMNLAVVKFVRNFEISYHHEDIDTVNRLHNEPDRPMKLRFRPLYS